MFGDVDMSFSMAKAPKQINQLSLTVLDAVNMQKFKRDKN